MALSETANDNLFDSFESPAEKALRQWEEAASIGDPLIVGGKGTSPCRNPGKQ